MTGILKMPLKFQCPLCESKDMIDLDDFVECPHCNRKWYKEFLSGKIDKGNVLSEEELSGIVDGFSEDLKDPEKQKRFLEALKKLD